jgi:hypothetical protein
MVYFYAHSSEILPDARKLGTNQQKVLFVDSSRNFQARAFAKVNVL